MPAGVDTHCQECYADENTTTTSLMDTTYSNTTALKRRRLDDEIQQQKHRNQHQLHYRTPRSSYSIASINVDIITVKTFLSKLTTNTQLLIIIQFTTHFD
ncbi:unnamed protein product [Absidia cylindrospora]